MVECEAIFCRWLRGGEVCSDAVATSNWVESLLLQQVLKGCNRNSGGESIPSYRHTKQKLPSARVRALPSHSRHAGSALRATTRKTPNLLHKTMSNGQVEEPEVQDLIYRCHFTNALGPKRARDPLGQTTFGSRAPGAAMEVMEEAASNKHTQCKLAGLTP